MEKLRIVQIGCGKMSKYTMRYVYEKGAEIVGAFDINEKLIGKDISEIIECDNKNIKVENINLLDERLKEINPDAAIVTTMSLIKDVHDVLRTCVKNGINTITTCEEAFFASNSNPKIFRELDVLAKANNCTITGCGYQDIFWGNLISVIAGSTHKITKIKGSSSYSIDPSGKSIKLSIFSNITESESKYTSLSKKSKSNIHIFEAVFSTVSNPFCLADSIVISLYLKTGIIIYEILYLSRISIISVSKISSVTATIRLYLLFVFLRLSFNITVDIQ